MIVLPPNEWLSHGDKMLKLLLGKEGKNFTDLKSAPKVGGIYLITLKEDHGNEVPLYVGRSKMLHRRLYTNHLMGPISNARLKKYLLKDQDLNHELLDDVLLAKEYIKKNCVARWIVDEEIRKDCCFPNEEIFRLRGALEGYFAGVLFPKYGIYEEH